MSVFPLEALSLAVQHCQEPGRCVYLFLGEMKNISSKGNLWNFQFLGLLLKSETDLKNQNKEADILWELWQTWGRGLPIILQERLTAQLWGVWLADNLQLLAPSRFAKLLV